MTINFRVFIIIFYLMFFPFEFCYERKRDCIFLLVFIIVWSIGSSSSNRDLYRSDI